MDIKIKYIARCMCLVVLLLSFSLVLTSCRSEKVTGEKTTSSNEVYTHTYSESLSDDDADKLELSIEYPEKKDKNGLHTFTATITRGGKKVQVLNLKSTLEASTFAENSLISFEDINSDGYKDLVVLYDRYSGSNMSYNIWLWASEENKFTESVKGGDNSFSDYSVDSEASLVVTRISNGAAAGEYRVYTFDDSYAPVLKRSMVYEPTDDGKLHVSLKDYSNGTFLMYDTVRDDLNEDMLLVGLDKKTVTEAEAEAAVHAVAGSEKSGVHVDCEGLAESNGSLYYLLRVDKANVTSAYYLVSVSDGKAVLKTSSAELI